MPLNKRIFPTFLFIFLITVSNSQNDISRFREFEKRVKYAFPDSLNIVSEKSSGQFSSEVFRLWSKGKYHFWKSEYDLSYNALSKAKSLCEKETASDVNRLLAAEISLDISSCLSILENTGKALDEILYAKEIFEISGTKTQKAKALIALGELYRKIGQYEKSTRSLLKAKKFIGDDPELMASYYNRRAAIKSETNQMDSAYYFSKMALAVAQKIGDKSLMGVSENEIGYILKHKGEKDSAVIHFKKAESLFASCGMTAYALQSAAHYSMIISENGNFKEAIRVLTIGYQIAKKNNWYRIKRDYSEYLRNAYFASNLSDSSDYYEIERLQSHIQLINSQNEMSARLVESIHEEQKYNEQLEKSEELLKDEKFQREKAESEKKFMTVVIFLSALVLVLLLIVVIIQIKRRRLVVKENIEKEKQNTELQLSLKNNEALIQEIHHRVKNNLQFINSLVNMQINSSADDVEKESLLDASRRIKAMGLVHEMLYNHSEMEGVDIKAYLLELVASLKDMISSDSLPIKFKTDISSMTMNISDTVSLGMITSELISNSIKHAFHKTDRPRISISLYKNENNEIVFKISDNGIGLHSNKTRKKTLGMRLIDIFSRQLNGKYEMRGENGFEYELKLNNQ